MPISTTFPDIFSKMVINLGYGPIMYLVNLTPVVIQDTIHFKSPIAMHKNQPVCDDGLCLYHNIINASENFPISHPLKRKINCEINFRDIDIVIDDQFHAVFHFYVDKGFIDGRTETINDVSKIGIYWLGMKPHQHLDWWNNIQFSFPSLDFFDVRDVVFRPDFKTVDPSIPIVRGF